MDQVTMGSVDFKTVDAGFDDPLCGILENGYHALYLILCHFMGYCPIFTLRDGTGSDGLFGAIAKSVGPGFSPAVGQLDAGCGAVFLTEFNDAAQTFDLAVIPDSQITLSISTAGCDSCGFEIEKSNTAEGSCAVVDQVNIASLSGLVGLVNAHRRHDSAVADLKISELYGCEYF